MQASGRIRKRSIGVLDNCDRRAENTLQTALCYDNVPIKEATDKGGESGMVMRKKDNYHKLQL